MEATERVLISHNWIALVFIASLGLLFFLKLFNSEKMRGFSLSIFNKGFIEIQSEEKQSIFSLFELAFLLFSMLNLGMTVFFLLEYLDSSDSFLFSDYVKVNLLIAAFILCKSLLESALVRILDIQNQLVHYLLSKRGYLYSITVGLLFLNIIYFYGFQNIVFLITGVILLFMIRFLLTVIHNKNLIFKELFYFILYLCAFEIAPLLILFRWIR